MVVAVLSVAGIAAGRGSVELVVGLGAGAATGGGCPGCRPAVEPGGTGVTSARASGAAAIEQHAVVANHMNARHRRELERRRFITGCYSRSRTATSSRPSSVFVSFSIRRPCRGRGQRCRFARPVYILLYRPPTLSRPHPLNDAIVFAKASGGKLANGLGECQEFPRPAATANIAHATPLRSLLRSYLRSSAVKHLSFLATIDLSVGTTVSHRAGAAVESA